MYNGVVNVNNLDASEILELLEACDELNFNELVKDLQNHLLIDHKEWIQQNLIYFYKISSKHQTFNLLQDYCNKLIDNNPELLLNSGDMVSIEKSMLITILERDDLGLDEINIWDHVIKWGIGQNQELRKDISGWNKEDFKILKDTLEDIIPLIRFNGIKSGDFSRKIKPYRKAFNKNIYEEILEYYLDDKWQPRLLLQKGPRITKCLLNYKMKMLISNWIDEKNDGLDNLHNLPYNFELILCGSQEGFSRSIFEKKCFNIKQTVVIMKLKETDELVGGYNPVCWSLKEMSSDEYYWIETDKSFIFKIDKNQIGNSILSRVKNPKYAIIHNSRAFKNTFNNIKFCEFFTNFGDDLITCNSIDNVHYCYYIFKYHKNNLNFKYKF